MIERRIVAKLDDLSIVFQCTECQGELVLRPKGKGEPKLTYCPQCAREWIQTPQHSEFYSALVQSLRRVIALEEKAFAVRIELRETEQTTLPVVATAPRKAQ